MRAGHRGKSELSRPRTAVAIPDDHGLVELRVNSYLGLPLVDATGDVLGHLAVMDVKPMDTDAINGAVMRTCAVRACMELERRAMSQIDALNRQLPGGRSSPDAARHQQCRRPGLTRDALFQAITTALRPVIQFDRSTIFLFDEQKKVLRLVSAESEVPTEHFVPGMELGLKSSHAGWTFTHQRPLQSRSRDATPTQARTFFCVKAGSLIVLPLIRSRQEHWHAESGSLHPMRYGEAEAELLQEVANQLALSVENMREHEEIGRLKAQLERENVRFAKRSWASTTSKEIVDANPQLTSVLHTIDRQTAPTDTTALILGETGTGKELVARAIHSRSPRHKHPLVKG